MLIPVVIRRDHPIRVPLMTAVYSATMGTAAALASGVSQPLAHLSGGWRLWLGIWAVPAAVAAVVWMLRRSQAAAEPERRPRGRDPGLALGRRLAADRGHGPAVDDLLHHGRLAALDSN